MYVYRLKEKMNKIIFMAKNYQPVTMLIGVENRLQQHYAAHIIQGCQQH